MIMNSSEKMRIRKILAILMCGAVIAGSFTSCRKNNSSEDDTPYLEGNLQFSVPDFGAKGDKITTGAPRGLHRSGGKDGVGITYAWYVAQISSKRDTTKHAEEDPAVVPGNYTFTIPDSLLTTLTVTCVASSEGYYSTTKSTFLTIVDPEKSLERSAFGEDSKVWTDPADGKEYRYMSVDTLDWMQQNYAGDSRGIAYAEYDPLTELYGRYLSWDDAVAMCPEGWRLPTVEEYEKFCGSFSGAAGSLMDKYAEFNGTRMWEYWPKVNPDNSRHFYALPTGFAMKRDSGYDYMGNYDYAMWWTADEAGEGQADAVYINEKEPDVMVGAFSKDGVLANVRYVRDNQ